MISSWECFHCAILELVRSAPIKKRLIAAYRRCLAALPEDELPGEVRESFALVMASLSGVKPQRGEDAVAASVRKMSNQEADECAALIVEIYGFMCRARRQPHGVDHPSADFDIRSLIDAD
jgi:hypothetical protein